MAYHELLIISELVEYLTNFMDSETLLAFAETNKRIAGIMSCDLFWNKHVRRLYPEIINYKPEDITWRQQLVDIVHVHLWNMDRTERLDLLIVSGRDLTVEIVTKAIKNGHMKTVDYLKSHKIFPDINCIHDLILSDRVDICPFLASTEMIYGSLNFWMNMALLNSSMKILNFLYESGYQPRQDYINYMILFGNKKVFDWLIDRNMIPDDDTVARLLTSGGYLDRVKKILEMGYVPQQHIIDFIAEIKYCDTVELLARFGHHTRTE